MDSVISQVSEDIIGEAKIVMNLIKTFIREEKFGMVQLELIIIAMEFVEFKKLLEKLGKKFFVAIRDKSELLC